MERQKSEDSCGNKELEEPVVYAVVILVSRSITGRLFDSKGENIIMYPAFIIFMIGMIFLSQARHGVTLLVAGACIGFGLGVVQSCG